MIKMEKEYEKNCIFCKIVKRELPSNIVYEDEKFIAFLDINPVNEGHTLVIPKKHKKNLLEEDEKILEEYLKIVKKLSLAVKKATNAGGINIINNVESTAGQVIFHTHIHIIPRFENDGIKLWPGKPYKNEEERKKIEEKIKKEIEK